VSSDANTGAAHLLTRAHVSPNVTTTTRP